MGNLKKKNPVIDLPLMDFSPRNQNTSAYWSMIADNILNPYTDGVIMTKIASKIKQNEKIERAM
jgi:hypothetical protein